jgi:Protein of unknown function (DUF1553)/Protein of unknown function (DUF1549)/Planctomycete cytochrome C
LYRVAWKVAVSLFALAALKAGDRKISFSDDVRPIFQSSCWKCHGSGTQVAKLDLSSKDSASRVLVPGDSGKSRLYRLVAGLEKPAMPMGGTLSPQQVETIRLWIDQGATWESTGKYWAFEKPVAAGGNSIDDFVKKALVARGLTPAPMADRRTLLRRAYLDLIGLPPTPDEANEFLNDQRPDAWEKLIDKLLASPHYGERWGRHWLDVARYADSNGFEHDFDRPNAWRYRDYVIRAFNQDKPYDTFLREQIAGDELPEVTQDSLIATGFLRNYAKVGFREKDNPENRFDYLDDMLGTIGRGVLGLTVQCARCHDHKFDPISQRDYYRMQASLFGYVEVDHPLTSHEVAEAYRKKTEEIDARVKSVRDNLRELERPYREQLLPAKYKRFPQNVQEAIATPEDKRTPGQTLLAGQVIRTVSVSEAEIDRIMKPEDKAQKQILKAEIARIEKERPEPIPVAMGITDGDYRFTPDGPGDEPAPGKGVKQAAIEGSFLHTGPAPYRTPPSYLLLRGDPNSKGPEMQPGFLSVITYGNPPTELPPANGDTSGRRRALAEWLVSKDNPLTARVMVNRIWQHHFGRGIVPTSDNFGKMGEMPSDPELLDWFAVEFMNRGWSIKQMHRLIMTSDAYKRASKFDDAADSEKDPQDRYLWRYPLQRLDAEIIRDSILAVSGGLNLEMFGRPVFPMLQAEILKSMSYGIWKQSEDGPAVWRRSVYVYRKRGLPYPLLDIFDLPNQNISCSARNVSTVPTQALTLMNDEFVLRQAQLFANRLAEAETEPAKQIDLAYRLALARTPVKAELQANLDFLATHKLVDFADVLLNLNEFLYVR